MEIADFLNQLGKPYIVKKKEHVFHQGEQGRNLFYVVKGILKAYYLTTDGKEFVKSFIMETNLIGSLSAAINGEANTFSLVCLEDCELVEVDFNKLLSTTRDDPKMNQIIMDILVKLAIKKEKREYQFLCLTPEERYNIIRDETPDLLNRVTQNDIARYLGITPVALSRIRSRSQK